jgi:hypothetical protein
MRGAWTRRLLPVCAAIAFQYSGPDAAATAPSGPDALFAKGVDAYGRGDLAGAIEAFAAELRAGWIAPEPLYDLGHCHLRDGAPGYAILWYRRAATLTPRDPDLRASLALALRQARQQPASPPWLIAALERLSLPEWMRVASAAWWVGAAAMALRFGFGPRRIWRAGLLAAALGLCIGLAGAGRWAYLRAQNPAVVVAPVQAVRLAPDPHAKTELSLTEGAAVRIAERSGDWLKIVWSGGSGWVPGGSAEAVWLPGM